MDSSYVLFFLAVITVSYRAKYHISNIEIKFHSTCIPNCLNVWHICQNAKCFHSFFAHYRAPPRVYIIHTPFNNIKQFVSTFKFHQSFAKKTFNSCIFLHSMAYIVWQDASIHIQMVGIRYTKLYQKCAETCFWHLFYRNDISVLLQFGQANRQWK